MPVILNTIHFVWSGLNANIPSGWSRTTDLDGKFIKIHADSVNPNTTGGASTHTHTVTGTHTHAMSAHTHSISLNAHTNNAGASGGGANYAEPSHTHASFNSGALSGGGLSAVTPSYGAFSNSPPYITVIFIHPTTQAVGLPDEAICLTDEASFVNNTFPWSGFYKCDGTNSTPNYTDKYLLGAGTGNNAGGTGGTTVNTHTIVHGTPHTVSAHSHASATSPGISGTIVATSSTTDDWLSTHTHSIALSNATVTLGADPSVVCSETVEPAYKKIMAVQNRSGGNKLVKGMLGLYLGTLDSIPSNWELVATYYGKYLKMTNTPANIGDIGGSNSHTHTSDSHSHTEATSHNHTATGAGHSPPAKGSTGTNNASKGTTAHPYTVSSVQGTFANATTSANSSSNEPAYRTVALLRLKSVAQVSAFIGLFVDNIK
jgi:hypothetical protein